MRQNPGYRAQRVVLTKTQPTKAAAIGSGLEPRSGA